MTAIVPISDRPRRTQQHGRIRTGRKHPDTGYPESLSTFRFTSSDRTALGQIAELYGGSIESWDAHGADRWEVVTSSDEIDIALPTGRDPLSGTPIYELYGRGGLQRRCDGVDACVLDGEDLVETACICAAALDRWNSSERRGKQPDICSIQTRIEVVLPNVTFGGIWLYTSGSKRVADEMPSFVETLADLQARGLTTARLRLERRSAKKGGKTVRFTLPVLALNHSIEEILSGEATLGGRAIGSRPETPVAIGSSTPDHEVDVIDVQSVDPVTESTWEAFKIACGACPEAIRDQVISSFGRPVNRADLDEIDAQMLITALGSAEDALHETTTQQAQEAVGYEPR